MTNNQATPEEIDRLRSDIATIRSAMDDTLPFTRTDIRFYWAITAAIGVCMAMELLGWSKGANRLLAMSPLLISFLAYLAYQWRKSRASSLTNPTVKKEYHFAIIAAPLLLAGLMAMRKWGKSLSISEHTFNGIGTSMLGLIMITISFHGSFSTSTYHRFSLRYFGTITALTGFVIPYISPQSICLAAYIYGFVALVPYIFWSRSLLKKQENSDHRTANVL